MSNLNAITHGAVCRPPRLVLLGEPKIGKSSFAAQAAAPVFIPVKGEEGIDALDVDRFPVATTYAEVLGDLVSLAEEEHGYKTVVIDSASALEPLIWAETCRVGNKRSIEDFGFGKGYVEALGLWREIQEALDALRTRGMASIIIGHAKAKTVSLPETEPYDSWVWDVNDRAANQVYRWADAVYFAGRDIYVAHGEKKDRATDRGRYLYTQRTATHPCGGRGAYGRLPDRIPLDYQAFRDAYRAAVTPATTTATPNN